MEWEGKERGLGRMGRGNTSRGAAKLAPHYSISRGLTVLLDFGMYDRARHSCFVGI